MATDSVVKSCTNTLSTTVADTVNLLQCWDAVEVTNHDSTNKLYFRQDGTTAVAEADGTTCVLPGETKVVRSLFRNDATNKHQLSLVGNGNVYTVEGVN